MRNDVQRVVGKETNPGGSTSGMNNEYQKVYEIYNNILKFSHLAFALKEVSTRRFIDVNDEFVTLFGYSRAEILLEEDFLLNQEGNRHATARREITLLNGGISKYTRTIKYEKKDGVFFWGQTTRSVIEADKKRYIIISITDITEQKNAEVLLSKSEKMYRQLFDHSLNTIGVYDIDSHCFIDCNRTFTQIYGYERDDLAALSALDLAWEEVDKNDPVYQQRYQENIDRLRSNETIRFESAHRSKEGKKIIVDVILIPFYEEEKLYIKQVTTDITERTQAREKLQQKMNELEEANASLKKYIESNLQLENFAHITSHDLREPINTIISFSKILKQKLNDKLSPKEEQYVDFLIKSGTKLKNMIDDILAFSKVNPNDVSFESIDIHELLNGILLDLNQMIKEKKAVIHMDKHLPVSVTGHASYIYQLCQNLIKNAIKFNKPGENPVVSIHYKCLNTHHQFCIEDKGIGIEKEFFDKIFLIFQKLNPDEKYKGSGIGLAVCKKVVELHEGKIWVESEVGQGTRFYFTIAKELEV